MAIITLSFSCFIGFLAAVYHVGFLGGTLTQGFVTYLLSSVATIAVIGASSWATAVAAGFQRGSSKSAEQELEEWRDWQFQEDIADAAARGAEASTAADEFVAPKRKSA